jgi:hypothetical protein
MATNKPVGDGHRAGAVKKRSQLKTKMQGEEHFTKRDKSTGEFMAQKKDDEKVQRRPAREVGFVSPTISASRSAPDDVPNSLVCAPVM